ncbi:MAG: TonB-dependent receptor, partial [Thermodesulfobacteriota bacterium]
GGRADYTRSENYDLERYVDFNNSLVGTKLWVTNIIQGLEANANIRATEQFSILIGADQKNYDWENESFGVDAGEGELPETRSAFDAKVRTTGYYLEGQYRPFHYIKGIAGIRQENHSTFGTETLPLFGIIINPSLQTVLKINHGKHFLAPTPNDLFWPYQDFGYFSFQGNPDLKPETGWHSDATLEHRFLNDKVAASLSYFQWDINDKIEWLADENWLYRPVNLDSFNGKGWEAGLRIGPYEGVQLTLSYTYTDAEEETAYVTRRATYTPNHQFKAAVTHWAEFGLTTQLSARYVGDRYYYGGDKTIQEPVGTLDSYWTADIRMIQRVFEHWSISVSGNNLFDKKYETYFSPFYDYNSGETTLVGFPGGGRSLFLSISYDL